MRQLYQQKKLRNMGYVVYRDVSPEMMVKTGNYVIAHKVAEFVSELEAQNYCDYRNYMTEKYLDDDVTKIMDF